MGDGGGDIAEKGFVFILFDEGKCLIVDEICGVIIAFESGVRFWIVGVFIGFEFPLSTEGGVVDRYLAIIIPEVGGVEVMGNSLAVVAKPSGESLFKGFACGAWSAQAPFAKPACRITLL